MRVKINLFTIIEKQRDLLAEKDELIAKLANENAEQENFIKSLLLEGYCDN